MKLARSLLCGVFAIGMAGVAQAQSACDCSVPATGGPVGEIIFTAGEVLASTSATSGLAPATVGTKLSDGSQILVGNGGTANISVGNSCFLPLNANTDTSFQSAGGQMCVQVKQTVAVNQPPVNTQAQVAQVPPPPPPIPPELVLLGLGGGAAAAAFAAFGGGDDPSSP